MPDLGAPHHFRENRWRFFHVSSALSTGASQSDCVLLWSPGLESGTQRWSPVRSPCVPVNATYWTATDAFRVNSLAYHMRQREETEETLEYIGIKVSRSFANFHSTVYTLSTCRHHTIFGAKVTTPVGIKELFRISVEWSLPSYWTALWCWDVLGRCRGALSILRLS